MLKFFFFLGKGGSEELSDVGIRHSILDDNSGCVADADRVFVASLPIVVGRLGHSSGIDSKK